MSKAAQTKSNSIPRRGHEMEEMTDCKKLRKKTKDRFGKTEGEY